MKCLLHDERRQGQLSLPAWGAWIEIVCFLLPFHDAAESLPHGERGLKSYLRREGAADEGRSPHGERGLKYVMEVIHVVIVPVAPRMGSVD